MKEEIFQDCLEVWKKSDGHTPIWEPLAKKWGYSNGETLRQDVKYERRKRGIHKNDYESKKTEKRDLPRVAVLDIETLPGVGYFWGLWDQNIGLDQIVSDSCMLGWAGKFLNEPEMYSDILTPKEAVSKNDRRIAKSCWDFLSQCDVVIGHNFQSFDSKIINTAFLLHDLPPLKFIIIDTLLVARQNFRFTSNKLKFINQKLGIRNKMDNDGFPLWKECHNGKEESLKKMNEYNEGDILSTEELYYKIRPYVRNFNVALYNEVATYQCPVCGGENLSNIGWYYTPAGKWESVRCDNCKSVSRKKENLLDKKKKKKLLINS